MAHFLIRLFSIILAKVETRKDSVLKIKIEKMLYSRRGRVSQATIFCLWASCITLLLRKLSRAQHSRFLKPNTSGFLSFFLREQVLFLTKAGKNSLFFSMRSTSVKYIYIFFYAAICKIPCQNGGTCSKPNQCTCPTGYGSKTCNKRK